MNDRAAHEIIIEYIAKPSGELVDTDIIKLILKRRLTKKEYKVLMQQIDMHPELSELKSKLGLDDERYDSILSSIRKKLNKNNIKAELFLT